MPASRAVTDVLGVTPAYLLSSVLIPVFCAAAAAGKINSRTSSSRSGVHRRRNTTIAPPIRQRVLCACTGKYPGHCGQT
jgi:hypothetical protein